MAKTFYPLSPIHHSNICVLPNIWCCKDFTMIPLFLPPPKYLCWSTLQQTLWERDNMAGVPERIGALKSLVMSRFKPWLPGWQAGTLSSGLCPWGNVTWKLENATFCVGHGPIAPKLWFFRIMSKNIFFKFRPIGKLFLTIKNQLMIARKYSARY